MDRTPILVAKKITKRFEGTTEIEILKGIDIELYPHKSAAIIGKSGEGKTTLLHILATIDEPTSGELFIAGEKVEAKERDHLRSKHCGFIFQAFHLINDASVIENILMPAAIMRKSVKKGSDSYKRAGELAHMVGLEKRLYSHAIKLSGGERQRVAIARAFMNDPSIIFADEPTGNLDHETAHEVQQLLLDAVQKRGKALLLVTHNLELAKLLDECYELEEGHLRVYNGKQNNTSMPHKAS